LRKWSLFFSPLLVIIDTSPFYHECFLLNDRAVASSRVLSQECGDSASRPLFGIIFQHLFLLSRAKPITCLLPPQTPRSSIRFRATRIFADENSLPSFFPFSSSTRLPPSSIETENSKPFNRFRTSSSADIRQSPNDCNRRLFLPQVPPFVPPLPSQSKSRSPPFFFQSSFPTLGIFFSLFPLFDLTTCAFSSPPGLSLFFLWGWEAVLGGWVLGGGVFFFFGGGLGCVGGKGHALFSSYRFFFFSDKDLVPKRLFFNAFTTRFFYLRQFERYRFLFLLLRGLARFLPPLHPVETPSLFFPLSPLFISPFLFFSAE